ncbi:MAG: hypothetical protein KDC44_23345, partial [Phaeodactylibacter sp.]|nr:hypothetical protein [Phaeodactylibacter sp.]
MRGEAVALILLLLLPGCRQRPATQQILFLGHPYYWIDAGNRLDPLVEQRLQSNDFDQIWLGGDVCAKTTEKPETLHYLD